MLVQDEFSAGHGFNVNWNENGNFNLNGNNDKSNVNANNRGVRPVLALSFLNTPFIYKESWAFVPTCLFKTLVRKQRYAYDA